MKTRRQRSFSSVKDIVRTYMPKHSASTEAPEGHDPGEAGAALAKRLVDSVRGEITQKTRRNS